MNVYLLVLSLFLISCTDRIQRPNPDIQLINDYLHYKGHRFSGIVEERFDQVGTIRESRYVEGRMTGYQEEYTEKTKVLLARRLFVNGEKDGTHQGWFPTGQRRFHYEYKKGKSHGEFWEWYQDGQPSLFAKYDNDTMIGKKMWRQDGKIYMNYVFTEGKAYGVPGTKLCYQVRDTDTVVVKK